MSFKTVAGEPIDPPYDLGQLVINNIDRSYELPADIARPTDLFWGNGMFARDKPGGVRVLPGGPVDISLIGLVESILMVVHGFCPRTGWGGNIVSPTLLAGWITDRYSGQSAGDHRSFDTDNSQAIYRPGV
ncbi:MAG: hypothetical protein R3C44_05160 [Chloroflexota bacterium]